MTHAWSQSEDKVLKDNYGKIPPGKIAEMLNRSEKAVLHRAFRTGTKGTRASHPKNIRWTEDEEKILIEKYSSLTWTQLEKHLGHSRNAIRNRASMLRITKTRELPQMSDLDAAYLAGLLDGEGSIMINCHRDGLVIVSAMPKVSISSTSLELLKEVSSFFLLKDETEKPPELVHYHRADKPNQRTGYALNIGSGKRAKKAIEFLLPFLRLKKKQAEIVLEFIAYHRNNCFTLQDLKYVLSIREANDSLRINAIHSREDVVVMIDILESLKVDPDANILNHPDWLGHCRLALEKAHQKY